MKKVLRILFIFMIILMIIFVVEITAASSPILEKRLDGQMEKIKEDAVYSEWVDRETGVHYYYTHSGGFELRVNADGSPFCEKKGSGQQ